MTEQPNASAYERCPLSIPDCGMWADNGRVDLHYHPGEAPQSCFICGDPLDHYGHAHGLATGDEKVRADVT